MWISRLRGIREVQRLVTLKIQVQFSKQSLVSMLKTSLLPPKCLPSQRDELPYNVRILDGTRLIIVSFYFTGDSISRIMARRRRSNKMLIIVTVTHFLSWLPLNVVNIIFTTFDSDKTPLFSNIEHIFITYACGPFSQYDFSCKQPDTLWVHEWEL